MSFFFFFLFNRGDFFFSLSQKKKKKKKRQNKQNLTFDVDPERRRHGVQPPGNAHEQPVHSRQVLPPPVRQQRQHARPFLAQERLGVRRQKRVLRARHQPRARRGV